MSVFQRNAGDPEPEEIMHLVLLRRLPTDPTLDPSEVCALLERCEFGRGASAKEFMAYRLDRHRVLADLRRARADRATQANPQVLAASLEPVDRFETQWTAMLVREAFDRVCRRYPLLHDEHLKEQLWRALEERKSDPELTERLQHAQLDSRQIRRMMRDELEVVLRGESVGQLVEDGVERHSPQASWQDIRRVLRRLLATMGLAEHDDSDDHGGGPGSASPPAPVPGARVPLSRRPVKAGPFPTPFPSPFSSPFSSDQRKV